MKYLMPYEYSQFIFNAIGLDIEQTANYFNSEYLNHKEHNPAFEKELGKTIIAFGKEFDNKIERQKQSMASIDEIIDEEGTHYKINFENSSFPISEFFPGVHPLQNIFTHIDNKTIYTLLTAWENFTSMQKENDAVIEKYNKEFLKRRFDTFEFIYGAAGTPTNHENFPEKIVEFIEWAIKSLVEINDKHGINLCRVALYEITSFLKDLIDRLRDVILIHNSDKDKYLLDHSRFIIGNLYEKIHEVFTPDLAWQLDVLDFATTVNEPLAPKTPQHKTTQKTQILILKELGVFDLPLIQSLTLEQKGLFFSSLLNMNFDNAKDYIGNIHDTKGSSSKSPYNSQSVKQANELLTLINLTLIK